MKRTLSDLRRGLMLDVCQGHPGIPPLLFHLHKHYPKCDLILLWLKNNNLTGQKLIDWIQIEKNRSPLEAFTYALRKIERDGRLRLVFGKEWVA